MKEKAKKLRNLLEFKDRNQVREFLGLASGISNQSDIDKKLLEYITNAKFALHGFFDGSLLHGLIGIEILEKKRATIRHIAVRPEDQKTGIGRLLIESVQTKYKLKEILAETDSDAEAFYKKTGFELLETLTDENGRERFKFNKVLT